MYWDYRLWRFTSGVRGRIAATVLVGLLSAAAGIARLGALGWLLGKAFDRAEFGDLAEPAAVVAAIMAARAGLEYLRAMMAHHTAGAVQVELRRRIYDQVVALGPAHFMRQRTGDITLSLVEGVEQLEIYFGQYLPALAVAALTPPLVFAFLVWLDAPIAAVLLVAALVTLAAPAIWHRRDSAASQARQESYGAFAAEFLDSIQGLSTLKAFGQSGPRAAMLVRKAHKLFGDTMWVLSTNTLARGITDTGIAVGAAVALGWGAWRVVEGEMALATLLIVLMLGVEVFRPLREIRGLLHYGMVGLAAAHGIFRLLDAKPVIRDPATPLAGADSLAPSVAFENVRFAYPGNRAPAHRGLDFALRAGERVGIVGASGSGKSTVVKLLLRFHDPDSGRVVVGGHDVRDWTEAQLRARIAVVSQDNYLFHGTVEDNLRMGKPGASQDEIERAAHAANAHGFVARLPDGYRTVVGERGVRLSGGQRQRIAIARALLRDAPILVLDEALSAVDAENEAVIQEALDRLMVGRTTIVLAHRLSSVIGCDRILVLDGGRVAESGTHGELMRADGIYRRLMAAQVRDTAPDVLLDDGERPPGPDEIVEAQIRRDAPEEPTEAAAAAEEMGWGGLIRVLTALIAPWRGRLALVFALGVARVAAFIGIGVLSALVVAAVKSSAPFDVLLIALAVLAPSAGVLHWLESWLAHDMAYRLLAAMRIDMFRKLDALAPAYFARRRTGDLLGVATHDIELVEYFFAHTIAPAFVAVVVPASVLAILAWQGWMLAAALAPFLLYAGLSPVLGRARIDALGARAREALGELNAHAVDTVQGLAEIVAYQDAGRRGAQFAGKARDYLDIRMALFDDLSRQTVAQELATGLGGLAVVIAGVYLANTGALEMALVPLLALLAMAAFLPVSEIAHVGRQLADTLGSTRRIYAVHSEPVPVLDGPGAPRPVGAPAVEFADITFSYPGRGRRALEGVAFTAARGTTTALVGPSGAGKTTLANLMLRFWDPGQGEVRLDGVPLTAFKLDDLRRCIALVAQDTYLFNDSLRANIAIARPEADDGQIREAASKAALDEFIAELPDGLDTVVGERGAQLSGGQRQRVAIARAFLKDAPVLVLDEATSHLDALSEAKVRAALDLLMRERTTIVIAHRLSTVREAAKIVALEDGRMVESGTHAELLARGGLYARLVSRQLGGGLGRAAQ